MKKFLLITFLFISASFYTFSEVKLLSGRNNLPMLKNAKPIYVLLTFEGILIYGSPMDVFLNDKKVNAWKLTREGLIKEYTEKASSAIKGRRNKKYGMSLINSWSQAKNGFVLVLNFDRDTPVPPFGANCQATATFYKVGVKNPIVSCKIIVFDQVSGWMVKFHFGRMGQYFIDYLEYQFLNHIDSNSLGMIN